MQNNHAQLLQRRRTIDARVRDKAIKDMRSYEEWYAMFTLGAAVNYATAAPQTAARTIKVGLAGVNVAYNAVVGGTKGAATAFTTTIVRIKAPGLDRALDAIADAGFQEFITRGWDFMRSQQPQNHTESGDK